MSEDIKKEFFYALMKLNRQSLRSIKLKELYAGEYMALRTIYRLKTTESKCSDGVKTSDIGDCLSMKKPATSKMLNNLEDKGYIKRFSNKKDRRITYIDLTEEGENLLIKHHQQVDEFLDNIINKMGEDDIKMLINLLNKLSNVILDTY